MLAKTPLVGNTPLVAVTYRLGDGEPQVIYVKCEQYNPTGSIKDRVAAYVLQKALELEQLRPGNLIVTEGSSNSRLAYAAAGKQLGYRVQEQAPGTEASPLVFSPRLLEHRYAVEAHERTTGREIGHAFLLAGLKPAAFVASVGSGATVTGVGNYLKTLFPTVTIHALEPQLNPPVDGDAVLMAQKIAQELAMPVGITSGANLLGAIKVQQELGAGKVVVTVFPDDNTRYAGTELFKPLQPGDHYWSPRIRLLNYR